MPAELKENTLATQAEDATLAAENTEAATATTELVEERGQVDYQAPMVKLPAANICSANMY